MIARPARRRASELPAPMAIVILFGLLSSTVLNMLVVPAMMLRFGSVRAISGVSDSSTRGGKFAM